MVLNRLWRYGIVKLKRVVSKKDKENIEKWKALKNKYNGERVFVIGNGPSLNKTPLYLLKNEYTVCFNRINLMFERNGWIPSFYMITDDLVVRDMVEEVNNDILPKVKYGFFPDLHPYNINFQRYIKKRDNVLWIKTDKPGFTIDLPNCGINNTVVNAGLQIMAYLGFKEIYLLGVDASIAFSDHKTKTDNQRELTSEADDPNHFDPRYFGKGRKYHYQPMYEIVEKFKVAKSFLENLGIKIINAGVNGKLEVYKRQSLESILNLDEQEKEKLFMQTVTHNGNDTVGFDEYFANAIQLTNAKDFTADMEKIVIPVDEGAKLISKAIFTHIPYGPYRNKYVFLKR